MGRKWTEEQRAEQGRKIRAALRRRKREARSSGRVVILTQGRVSKSPSRLTNEIDRAVEALGLVERIGWQLARELAGRMK